MDTSCNNTPRDPNIQYMSSVFLRFYIFEDFQGRAMYCGQTVTAQRCTDLKRRRWGAQSEMQVATINLNLKHVYEDITLLFLCVGDFFSQPSPQTSSLCLFFCFFFPPCRLSSAKERLHCHMFAFKSSVQRHTKTRRRLKRISRIIANKKPNFATEKGWLTFRSRTGNSLNLQLRILWESNGFQWAV